MLHEFGENKLLTNVYSKKKFYFKISFHLIREKNPVLERENNISWREQVNFQCSRPTCGVGFL